MKSNIVVFLIFGLVALGVIAKVFVVSNCAPFDSNDDKNHTFVNLFSAIAAMREGSPPQINLFNNFGTAVLGDALTYPFALQALTYWYMEGPNSMGVNRVCIAFLTLLAIFFLFRTLQYSVLTSVLVSLASFFEVGNIWVFAHHHYQFSQLGFCSLLIIFALFAKGRLGLKGLLLGTYVASIIFILSVSISVTSFGIPSALIAGLILVPNSKRVRFLAIGLFGIVAAFTSTSVQTFSFASNVASSVRLGLNYWDGHELSFRALIELLLGKTDSYYDFQLNVSQFFLIVIPFGLLLLWNRRRDIFWIAFILGLCPFVGVNYLMCNHSFWHSIPLLKTFQITRFLWLTTIFLYFALAEFCESVLRVDPSRRMLTVTTGLSILLFVVTFTHRAEFPLIYVLASAVSTICLLWVRFQRSCIEFWGREYVGPIVLSAATVLSFVQIPTHFFGWDKRGMTECRTSHHFSTKPEVSFLPKSLAALMAPFSRYASDLDSVVGIDLEGIFHNLLGSGGRSILMNGAVKDGLLKRGVIESDGMHSNYHFLATSTPQQVAPLGIRYFLTRRSEPQLLHTGWTKLGDSAVGDLRVFESPIRPTPFYLNQPLSANFIREYTMSSDSISIRLPMDTQGKLRTLHVAFTSSPFWKLTVDGRIETLESSEFNFMKVELDEREHVVVLSYQEFSWIGILSFFSLGLTAVLIFFVVLSTKYQDTGEV